MVLTHLNLTATATTVLVDTPLALLSSLQGSSSDPSCTLAVYDAATAVDAVAANLKFEVDVFAQTVFNFDFADAVFLKGITIIATLGGAGPVNLVLDWD